MSTRPPLAYLLTYRTYGTWLHGDPRGSHHHGMPVYGSPRVAPSQAWQAAERARLIQPPTRLGGPARALAEQVARAVCSHHGWHLLAVNARSEHVHAVVTAPREPRYLLRSLKAWTTRRLVEAGLSPSGHKVWSRHGSTLYLWTAEAVERAVWYVVVGQDEPTVAG
jgi:REP element-mobilizing transposase RayT